MIVCLDSGNSRIKWGVHDGQGWLEQGALAHDSVADLAGLTERWPRPECVMLANVAGAEAAGRIRDALSPWLPVFHEARSEANRCGVSNGYRNPTQLGVDRWCALIGAAALVPGAALVVMAGTATTIDTLDADKVFRGGLILPGLDLMRTSLGRGTADLPMAAGNYDPFPRCTDDAIVSGVLEAQAGAIERCWQRLESNDKTCLVSGGYAEEISARLAIPCRIVANLPMEGLARLALDARRA